MYLWIVRLATWMPSFNSSPRVRSAPHGRFFEAMRRMSWMVSGASRGSGPAPQKAQACGIGTPERSCGGRACQHRGNSEVGNELCNHAER
jgi:hypothetical protein